MAVRTGSTDNSGAIELTATRRIRALIIQNLVSRRVQQFCCLYPDFHSSSSSLACLVSGVAGIPNNLIPP